MINPTFSRLLRAAFPYQKTLALAFGLLMISATAEVCGPILFKYFIDNYLTKSEWQTATLFVFMGCFLALQLLAAAASYSQSILLNKTAQKIIKTLRYSTFGAALHLPASYLDKHQTGHIISTISNDTETLLQFYVQVIGQSLQKLILLFGILIGMFVLNQTLASYVFVMVCLAVFVMFIYQKLSLPWSRKARQSLSTLNHQLSETLQGIPVIQSFIQEKHFASRFSQQNNDYLNSRFRMLKLNGLLLRPLIDLLYISTLCAILSQFAMSGPELIQVGIIYAFVSYMGRMIEPLNEITNQLTQVQQAIIAGERIFALQDEQQEPTGHYSAVVQGNIEFKHVSFRYLPEGPLVSQNISFHVRSGEMLAIVGHTGSGKSTLLHLLTGMYSYSDGEIFIDEIESKEWNRNSLRSQLGVIQQDPFIFTGTVAENIRFGRKNISDAAILQALQDVRWLDSMKAEDYLEMPLQENGKNLSSGQRQLLSFARALVTRPAVMLLDEATSSIDTHTERLLQQALAAIKKQHTWIVVAHRLSTIADADQILVMQHGKIIEQGTHHQLLSLNKHYAMLYQLQQTTTEVT